jgi:uncharacterized protein (UPF0303 family)
MNIDDYIDIAKKQEELLQFPHFNRRDAWELGSSLVNYSLEHNIRFSVSIRELSGLIVFQQLSDKTVYNNDLILGRKFNTILYFEGSSLLTSLVLKKREQTFENRGLDSKLFVNSGGGFPIRIKNSGITAAFLFSGLQHLEDHDILVETISHYLNIPDVPRIPVDAIY